MNTYQVTATAFNESLKIRCNLTQATSPIQVDYDNGDGWVNTQYQCSDVRHRPTDLVELGIGLLALACECSVEDLGKCDWLEIQ